MPKSVLIIVGVVAVAAIGGGIYLATNNKTDDNPSSSQSTSQSSSKEVTIDDPEGVYKTFSDASITKHPEDNVEFGNGQTLTYEYDGSKSNNDPYATLSYQLFYIQDDGKVQPMGGGNLNGRGSGEFTTSDSVFTSNAANRKGFVEITVTSGTSAASDGRISGDNTKLGLYPVKFTVSE